MHLENTLNQIIENDDARNIAVVLGKGKNILIEAYKSADAKLNEFTIFDMASVTKIIATTTLSLIALDKGIINENDKVSDFLPCPDNRMELTVKNLLTHTIGIGHKSLCAEGYNYRNISDFILQIPLDIPVGSDVLYSCPGFVLMGKILEIVFKKPLDTLFSELVSAPLGLAFTGFLPKIGPFVNSNQNAGEIGLVNDYNCRYLGGVSGNAGIFSNMHDMKKYAQFLLKKGAPLISESTFDLAITNHTQGMAESRGLGFLLPDERYTQTGKLFKTGAFGHCGHTGQSIFIDPKSGLYAIILSDMTISTVRKFGAENYDIVMNNRRLIHDALYNDLA